MAKILTRAFSLSLLPLAVLAGSGPCAWAAAGPDPFGESPLLVDQKKIPETVKREDILPSEGAPENLYRFLSRRTQLGWGYRLEYNDNTNLQDNARREDYINDLEGFFLFADPRGALLYGVKHDFGAFRYMEQRINGLAQFTNAFIDFDPGGRYTMRVNYYLNQRAGLIFGGPGVDLLRRTGKLQRTIEHVGEGRLTYLLSKQTSLASDTRYSVFDDLTLHDPSIGRRVLRSNLDLDYSLTPTWTAFPGVYYERTELPEDKLKDSDGQGVRLGIRHETGPTDTLEATAEIQLTKVRMQKRSTDPNFHLDWKHELNPRTTLNLRYSNSRKVSFVENRTRFRSAQYNVNLGYKLTELIEATFKGNYEEQKSSSQDVVQGAGQSTEKDRLYSLGISFLWQLTEKAHVEISYTHQRSMIRDYTDRIAAVDFGGTF